MELAIIAICGVIAAIWAVGKTATAIRTLHEQRRSSAGWERAGGYSGYAAGGIDPGSSNDCGHGGGDCGGHGGDSGGHGGW